MFSQNPSLIIGSFCRKPVDETSKPTINCHIILCVVT